MAGDSLCFSRLLSSFSAPGRCPHSKHRSPRTDVEVVTASCVCEELPDPTSTEEEEEEEDEDVTTSSVLVGLGSSSSSRLVGGEGVVGGWGEGHGGPYCNHRVWD
ncbi:hypothetical protein F7725_000259 [Dissostichus mawsoni]|uniref:Uncharacterized protein n=1 Tax=Dissostichus mawsoni TaxID=36200 RepID=A0A7J5ZDW1_DISMA|nr:hypothetical protein F7725_000259 [Dissostichus mawsoni]